MKGRLNTKQNSARSIRILKALSAAPLNFMSGIVKVGVFSVPVVTTAYSSDVSAKHARQLFSEGLLSAVTLGAAGRRTRSAIPYGKWIKKAVASNDSIVRTLMGDLAGTFDPKNNEMVSKVRRNIVDFFLSRAEEGRSLEDTMRKIAHGNYRSAEHSYLIALAKEEFCALKQMVSDIEFINRQASNNEEAHTEFTTISQYRNRVLTYQFRGYQLFDRQVVSIIDRYLAPSTDTAHIA